MFDAFDLNKKLVSELREIAKSLNIEKYELMKKAVELSESSTAFCFSIME